jgi:hypothetical protein
MRPKQLFARKSGMSLRAVWTVAVIERAVKEEVS